ncbi:hypothetical protein D9758_005886 [Tetrapyrgos nigripes]|uniref:DNA2/NAM7 helicase-like C-terminal domain-containing protein n=1 Tax=Tetrapyrgos nigripes TaxID=182062 RepID=A0A8H5G2V3_9AGAR|nr:hypothetical protein D9758_005886 [Tetrapyrgos nigripes]
MDVCHEEHLRKLFYMQQFEVLSRLSELWKARIDGCPDAPILEYHSTQRTPNAGTEHTFYLKSGSLEMVPTSDKDRTMFLYILVQDDDSDDSDGNGNGSHLPVEALFDDLAISGLVFPLNQYTQKRWEAQHAIVQKELLLADVKDIAIDGSRTKVVLQTWGSAIGGETGLRLEAGQHYRLSPRLVDFNVNKVLSTLFELDLQAESRPSSAGPIPFLQLMLDPKSFKENSSDEDGDFEKIQEVYRQTGADMQRLFRELRGLDVEAAGALVLKASQNRAAQRILANRLTVIWGPPGTGKTHTIALSLLRLMHAQDKVVSQNLKYNSRKIIFVTAMTHAAIEAVLKKLSYLVECHRSIESLPTDWLEKVKIEHVFKGSDHPAPSRSRTIAYYLYAGTIYQLYNFSKKHSFSVDCVIIDEAGQLALSSAALVLRSLDPAGKIIIAGDSEQLSPILAAEYPKLQTGRLFGSILDCLMHFSKKYEASSNGTGGILRPPSPSPTDSTDGDFSSSQSTVVQLTENFRLNPDLGEFVSTIYSRAFKPQKVQARQLASALGNVENDIGIDFAIQPRIMESVQRFLLGLSKAMLRQPQSTLKPPPISGSSSYADSAANSIDIAPHPISLALLRLETFDKKRSEGIGYEVHVRAEALVAAALITSIQRCAPSDDIFVATPHRVQRQAVRAALATVNAYLPLVEAMERLGMKDTGQESEKPRRKGVVTVDTVERLQGSEAAFVICLFSLPQSSSTDLKFFLERRRLNVAISRAKTLCILVSSSEVLRPPVSVFADDASAKGYAFLRAFEDRAWQGEMKLDVDLVD